MSTGPGPTRKDDGSHDATVDDIAELLVEEESHPIDAKNEQAVEKPLDKSPFEDGLDVMLETPGPVLPSTFMPPPPAPAGASDEGDSAEEGNTATNLAYEDLLAKLVLPAKAPEVEATLPVPAPETSLPMPEAFAAPTPIPAPDPEDEPLLPALALSSSPSVLAAPPAEERTLVTENPLVAEEQQTAVREGRVSVTSRAIEDEIRPALTEPVAVGARKSKQLYLAFGGLCVVLGAALATIVLRLLMPSPAVQQPAVVAPATVPQPTPVPPAQVQPLPPTPPAAPAAAPAPTAPAAVVAAEPKVEDKPVPAPTAAAPKEQNEASAEAPAAVEADKPQTRPHKREAAHRTSHAAATPKPAPPPAAKPAPAPKPAPSPKAASAPKAATPAPAPAAKPGKPAKKTKAGGYADPFDN